MPQYEFSSRVTQITENTRNLADLVESQTQVQTGILFEMDGYGLQMSSHFIRGHKK